MIDTPKPSVRVLQYMYGDLEYFLWSEKINRSYCERHGYEYIVSREAPRRDRHVNWQKIPVMMNHLNGCDYLLFLDADAHFYAHELKIEEELIPLMNGKEILMAQDIGEEGLRWHPGLPNAGVILMKTGDDVHRFFETWNLAPENYHECRWQWPPIQLGLWYVVLPQFLDLVHVHPDYYMLQGHYGQYIRHYAAMSHEERAEKMKEYSRLHSILSLETHFTIKENTMFKIIQLALQVVFKPYSLGDKSSCKKFIENLLALIKPMAAANNVTLDDTIIAHIEKILTSDALFEYFFDLIANQLQSEELIFESADEKAIMALCETSNETMPEAVNPLVVISLVTQIISLINAIKGMKATNVE